MTKAFGLFFGAFACVATACGIVLGVWFMTSDVIGDWNEAHPTSTLDGSRPSWWAQNPVQNGFGFFTWALVVLALFFFAFRLFRRGMIEISEGSKHVI